MANKRWIPVVIGVGDIKNRSQKVEDAIEPMELMLQAISKSIDDTSLFLEAAGELQSKIDSVSVVNTWTWKYPDLPASISERIGVRPKFKDLSHHGGDSPAKLFDEAARRISFGQSKVAIVTGGEALASLGACAAAGKLHPPGWTMPDGNVKSVTVSDVTRFGENLGTLHSVGLPIHVYPLYENAYRARKGQSVKDNNEESAELYAQFATVAENNPLAWNYGQPAANAGTIGAVSKKNRMICFPYPLRMNAFNNVNLASACLLTSTEYAAELGIPENKWIYPLGGAGTSDNSNFWERPNFYSSPAISQSLDEGLRVSGLEKDQVNLFDFYSCFPIVPKLACEHLGLSILSPPKPITLLGGLTSFGGAGNNYSMHALTEMVRELRRGNGQRGLVLANGGMVTYQYVVCISSNPRDSPYPDRNPLPDLLTVAAPRVTEKANGRAMIETYTVEFNRDGSPLRGHVVGRLENEERFLANHGDESTLQQLASSAKEQIGRKGFVRTEDDGKNIFVFDQGERL